MDMLLELLLLVHDIILVMLLLVLLMLFPLKILVIFSNDCLVLFLELIFRHVSKGDSKNSFLNQTLHLANLHDKLSTFVLYPSLGFPSIYQLTLCDPRLRHLSLSLFLSLVTCRKEDS
jgi:hypothetical protein